MKTQRTLIVLFVCSLIITKFSTAQNEIENYNLPKLIEGSNLYLSFSPGFLNYYRNDSISNRDVSADLGAEFIKWKFTRRTDFSADIKARGRWRWVKYTEPRNENIYNTNEGNIQLNGGLNYYPVKDLLYGGAYISSYSNFANHNKPASRDDIFAYAGTGRLLNAGQIIYTVNFQNVLIDEGLTSKSLPPQVMRKLTALFDKRRNSEFTSKYHDDADIEFFSQIEELLRDEKIISGPLSSRTTLKLYQALTNSSFIYFPRYRGYMVQAELGFSNKRNEGTYFERGNSLRLILSGVYGLPIGLKTDLVFSGFAGIPLNNEPGGLFDYPLFHSPLILRENATGYYPENISPIDTEKYDFTGGIKMLAYYNISSTAGLTGYANLSYGKTETSDNNFAFSTAVNFKYNILSRMIFNAATEFYRYPEKALLFNTKFEINYIVF